MAFPTSIDSFTNPNATDALNTPPHHTQHSNENDAIVAIETKLGIDSSVPISNSVLASTASGHSSFSTDPTLASLELLDHLDLTEESAPAVSDVGKARVYVDSGHILYASINGVAYKKIIRTGDDFVASGASHASGLVPDPGVTAGTSKFLSEDATWKTPAGITNLRTAYASRPAAGVQGRVWQASNSIFQAFDDGATWDESVFGQQVKSTNGFPSSWFNQPTGSTIDITKGGAIMVATPSLSLGEPLIVKTLAPPYTITVAIIPNMTPYNISGGGMSSWFTGLCVLDHVSGKFIEIVLTNHNAGTHITPEVSVNEWTNKTTFTAGLGSFPISPGALIWLRITDNSTTRAFQISYDSINFVTLVSHASGTFVTPTRVGLHNSGFYDNAGTPPTNTVTWFVSWDEF